MFLSVTKKELQDYVIVLVQFKHDRIIESVNTEEGLGLLISKKEHRAASIMLCEKKSNADADGLAEVNSREKSRLFEEGRSNRRA